MLVGALTWIMQPIIESSVGDYRGFNQQIVRGYYFLNQKLIAQPGSVGSKAQRRR